MSVGLAFSCPTFLSLHQLFFQSFLPLSPFVCTFPSLLPLTFHSTAPNSSTLNNVWVVYYTNFIHYTYSSLLSAIPDKSTLLHNNHPPPQ
jgi:hypothetical protein